MFRPAVGLRVSSRRNLSYPSRRSSPNSRSVNLLQPLRRYSVAPVLCFQQLAASFPKTPGWGVPRFPFQLRTTHYPLPSFVQRRAAISRISKSLRTLSVVIGGGGVSGGTFLKGYLK